MAKNKWAGFSLWHRLFFKSPGLGAGGSSISSEDAGTICDKSASASPQPAPPAKRPRRDVDVEERDMAGEVHADEKDDSLDDLDNTECDTEEEEEDTEWAPSPKSKKRRTGTCTLKGSPTHTKRRSEIKFEQLQEALFQQDNTSEEAMIAVEKARNDFQRDLLVNLETLRTEADDRRAKEQREWEDMQRRQQEEYDERRENMRREYEEKKEHERREYEERKERERDELNQERRQREMKFHGALLSKFCSK